MKILFLAAYTTLPAEPPGYHWIWRHAAIPERMPEALYSKLSKPLDVAGWSPDEVHGGVVSMDSEWCAVYRFLNAGRDAAGRLGRFFLIAGFLRRNDLAGVDVRQVLESPLFSTPLDFQPQYMEITSPSVATQCDNGVLQQLRNTTAVDRVGAEHINPLVSACAALNDRSEFSLQINGSAANLVCNLVLIHVAPEQSPEPPVIGGSPVLPKLPWKLMLIALIMGLVAGFSLGLWVAGLKVASLKETSSEAGLRTEHQP